MTTLVFARYYAPKNNADEFALSLAVQPIPEKNSYRTTIGFRVSWLCRPRGGEGFWGPDYGDNTVLPDNTADFETYAEGLALFNQIQKNLKTSGFTLHSVEHGDLFEADK